MTNKINDIDVATNNNNVYYSQKAVDELQNNIKRLQEENEKLKEENEQLKKPCLVMPKVNQLAVPIEEFKKLQEENEKLKRKKDEYYLETLDYETKISYLIQTLEEIRSYCNNYAKTESYVVDDTFNEFLEIIFDKTNEVLNDRD